MEERKKGTLERSRRGGGDETETIGERERERERERKRTQRLIYILISICCDCDSVRDRLECVLVYLFFKLVDADPSPAERLGKCRFGVACVWMTTA